MFVYNCVNVEFVQSGCLSELSYWVNLNPNQELFRSRIIILFDARVFIPLSNITITFTWVLSGVLIGWQVALCGDFAANGEVLLQLSKILRRESMLLVLAKLSVKAFNIHRCFELLWSHEAMDLCWVDAFAELKVLIIIWVSYWTYQPYLADLSAHFTNLIAADNFMYWTMNCLK